MANKELSQFLGNLTTEKQASIKLSKNIHTLQSVKMQLGLAGTLANNGNMTGVMTKLNLADQQLTKLIDNI